MSRRLPTPPVLVPPIKSKISHTFFGGSPALRRSELSRHMIERRIYSVESPRTPPPSRDRRQYPLLSSVRTGPECSLGNVGIAGAAVVGTEEWLLL